MKNYMAKFIKITICFLLILSLCGCWNSRELDTLGIIMGVGLDKPDEPGKVKFTAQVVKAGEIKSSKKDGGGGSSTEAFWNINNTGTTVFDTIRGLTRKSSRKLFFPHNQVIILGRALAEEGILKYIDFFSRDPETRVNVLVLVSEGTAEEVLDIKSELEKIPANNIAKLIKDESAATSQTKAVRIRDIITSLMSKTTAPIAPMIQVSQDGTKKSVQITDTAVFKHDKMVGKLNKIEGRGLMWILGGVKSGIIVVNGPGNDPVSLETIRASGKMVPEIKNNKITMKITIFEEGNIGEQMGTEDLSKLPVIALLEKNKSDVIRSEVMAAVEKAKELNADVFGFGEAVHRKYPKQWEKLEDKWDEFFPNIEVKVDIKAKLRLMGRISKPATPPEKEKK